MTTIVKRKGHSENYDSRKVYASAYAACLTVHMHHGEAELVADKVSKDLDEWLKSKKEVNSQDISNQVTLSLEKYNPDAAFMFKTHKDLS